MLAKVEQIDGAWQRLQSSRAFKRAEETCGFAAVCIVGTHGPQRRSWTDNQGGYPTRVVVTTDDPAKAAQNFNRGVHSVDGIYHTLAHVYVASREHGERVKAWLESQVQGEPMINNWRDVEGWQYEILFGPASETLGIEMFDEAERARRIWAKARRGSA